jgi:hypothetical protein
MQFNESMKYKPIRSKPHKLNKIKLCNQSENVQMGIVRKSFQPHNDKPKVSAIENIDKKMTTIQMVIEK